MSDAHNMPDDDVLSGDLILVDGQPMTTSRKVAERFGKQHKDVLRAIRALLPSEDEGQRNFAPTSYADSQGKLQPEYLISKDGFCLLAMGFTGSEALTWKRRFIKAFNLAIARVAALSKPPSVPLGLHEQAMKIHGEAKTSEALASICGRGLRKRRDEKPVFAQQLAQIERAMQICLFLGLDGLPDID